MKKELFEPYFKGKSVTVLGLGLLGRGVGDSQFLARHGALLTITDKKSATELASSVQALNEYPAIVYRLGGHDISDFENKDFILKAAGVPYDSEYVAHAVQNDIPVYMSASLLVDIVKKHVEGVTVIGITGTRGKSTTTELIAHILEQSGKRVHRGGNIRGMANLPLLEKIEAGDFLVLELDSWQLQGFGDMKLSPDIAVFTSFLDDHLNYYKNDRELYFEDKAKIFMHQRIPCLITSAQAASEIRKRYPNQEMIVPEVGQYEAKIIGEHNNVAISLALAASEKVGVLHEEAIRHVASFSPVHGRLENLGLFRGVTVYNDNNATTPDAVVAGIKAVNHAHNKKPIIILGGADKALDLSLLEKTIKEATKAHVLLAGTGTDKLMLAKDRPHETLEECVRDAFSLAEPGDVILFSPGFASFSKYFNNEYERNDRFVEEVQKYA
jgi:UDP-N-acetylmuramoylalanine--D-glutamate ligase